MWRCHFHIEVRWANQNEAQIKGSIDRAVKRKFPEYQSRRLAHWRRAYAEMDWEAVPDTVAAKVSQLPNKFRKASGAKLKGPGMGAYHLPASIEKIMAQYFWQHLL